jgi:hypothetical protein
MDTMPGLVMPRSWAFLRWGDDLEGFFQVRTAEAVVVNGGGRSGHLND